MPSQRERQYECTEHGPFAPARFCCACTRVPLEVENARLRDALETIATGHAFGPVEVARVALGLKASPTP